MLLVEFAVDVMLRFPICVDNLPEGQTPNPLQHVLRCQRNENRLAGAR